MKDLSKLQVAIVHDWLVGGGAELVVQELHRMFPDAPIYTSYCTDEWRKKLDNKVVTGYLQRWPFSRLRKYLPILRIWWFSKLDLSGYDLVISSSGNGEAKGIRVPSGTRHVCYCHTPTHFYWRHYQQYLKHPGFGPFASIGLRLLVGPLRRWDYKAAQRPDVMIANSTHIQRDIQKYYDRESIVIHPPVDTTRFAKSNAAKRHGFINVGRQVPYKKVDILIKACNKLSLPLTIIGNGPEHKKLMRLAGPTVTFKSGVSDVEVEKAMGSAEAFLFAAFEDFGITPVEALAAGTPVIAYNAGGALDYVQPGKNGEFFTEQTVQSLVNTLKKFDAANYQPASVAATAKQFGPENFRNKLHDLLSKVSEEENK